MATKPTGMRSSSENLSGLSSITTAVNVKIAADAPTKVVSGGKNGILKAENASEKERCKHSFRVGTLPRYSENVRNISYQEDGSGLRGQRLRDKRPSPPSRRFLALNIGYAQRRDPKRQQSRIRIFVALMSFNTNPMFPNIITEKHESTAYRESLLMIPTLNEEDAIEGLLREARAVGFTNVLVVDGFSSDRTRGIAERAGASVVLQEFGKGKGCGVRTGMRWFLEGSAELLFIIDGDGTNIPSYLLNMIPLIRSGGADVVLGSRTRSQRERLNGPAESGVQSYSIHPSRGEISTAVHGCANGLLAVHAHAVERIYPTVRSTGFEIELEIFVNAFKMGLHVSEVHVGFRNRKGFTKFSFMLRLKEPVLRVQVPCVLTNAG